MGNFAAYDNKKEALNVAYEQGNLLIHQLEMPFVDLSGAKGEKFTDFIDVLSGKPGSQLHTTFRDITGDSGDYKCFPTTYLAKDVANATFTNFNKVGFLFDGNHKDVKFIAASLRDLGSRYSDANNELVISPGAFDQLGKKLWEKQFPDFDNLYQIDLSKVKLGPYRDHLVKQVMQEITSINSSKSFSVMNEVLVNTNTKAVCGIVISLSNSRINASAIEKFKDKIAPLNAFALKAYFKERHQMELPLVSYNELEKDPEKRLVDFNIDRNKFNELKNYVQNNIPETGVFTSRQIETTIRHAERGYLLQQRLQEAELY